MKIHLATIILSISTLFTFGQTPEDRKDKREQLQAAKIGFITTQIDLTPNQAEKFWPLYNEYSEAKRKIRRELRKKKNTIDNGIDSMTESDLSLIHI